MGLTEFDGKVVTQLNAQDVRSEDLLDNVIRAATEIDNDSDVTQITDVADDPATAADETVTHESGAITWGGKTANLQGTGGVALLEFAKDAIQTAVSNISGVGTMRIQLQKAVERKVSNI